MDDFAEQIASVDRKAKVAGSGSDAVNKVAKSNALAVAEQLLECSVIIRKTVQEKRTRVVPGVYDLETGEVSWLESWARAELEVKAKSPPAGPAGISTIITRTFNEVLTTLLKVSMHALSAVFAVAMYRVDDSERVT